MLKRQSVSLIISFIFFSVISVVSRQKDEFLMQDIYLNSLICVVETENVM